MSKGEVQLTKSGKRTDEGAKEDRMNIINLIAEEGGGKSQNHLYQRIKEKTRANWATFRRDLEYLENEGFLRVEPGKRRAKLNYLTGNGFLSFLALTKSLVPPKYISEPNEDLCSFKRRMNVELSEWENRLNKLIEIIEREGQGLDFPIFSEIRILYARLGWGAIDQVIKISKLVGGGMLHSNLSSYIQQLLQQKKELGKNLGRIYKYPKSEGYSYYIKLGEIINFEEVDRKTWYEEKINSINRLLNGARMGQERLWRKIFSEHFFEWITYTIEDKKNKILNDKLHSAALELFDAKKNELKIFQEAINIFSNIKQEHA